MQISPENHRIIGIIPARWDSSRFPGKPLHPLLGKPLLQHVVERASQCQKLAGLLVATDDERIAEAAKSYGVAVAMTSRDHPTGTDRIAEAAGADPAASYFINIQGDEPLIDPSLVDELAGNLSADPSIDMITAASPIRDETQFQDPNIVKVVLNGSQDALYFSRSPIPYPRQGEEHLPLRHIGLYGYRADFLKTFVTWPPAPTEVIESLEQLRALHHGARIRVVLTEHEAIGLDTPEQVPHLEALLRNLHSSHQTT
ncbi:MAG: 3-deoxy-manno-octulosonate cytidylyltransferase [Verrucomicrobiota bacterium JB023]|nr:3-deoxy-manno-octulosonate cytidylyltransferase [Verrucomicrobiota bacterium JB023]